MLIEPQAGIDGLDAVVAAGEFAVGEENADVGLLAEFSLDAGDADFGALAVVGIVEIERMAGSAIVDGEEAEIPAAEFAGETAAEFRVDDAAREKEILLR